MRVTRFDAALLYALNAVALLISYTALADFARRAGLGTLQAAAWPLVVDGLIREHEGRRVPVILFTKGGGLWLESMANTGAEALGLDWTCDIGSARARVGDKVALQGNMDPAVLYAKPEAIRAEVARILGAFGNGNGHVFNLGHGVTPEVDPAHAGAFFEAVHELSAQYH